MNGRTEVLMSTFSPRLAIVVHKSSVGNEYYLESHDINDQGQIMSGKPLQQSTIQEMIDVFFDEKQNRIKISGFIPENLLHFDSLNGGHYKMIWYRPAEIRFMHFASQLKLKSAKTWVPAMVYAVIRGELSVFALKNNLRPGPPAKLFRAPFHNVGDEGRVCLGNARVKKPNEKSYEAYMKYWEDLFWLSEFTHLNGATNPTKTDVDTVWKRLLASKTKTKWNDLGELKEMRTTKFLKSILK